MISAFFNAVKLGFSGLTFLNAHDARSLYVNHTNLNKQLKIFLNWFIGPVLFVWLAFSIYKQVSGQQDLQASWQHILDTLVGGQWKWLLLVFVLMFVNWGLEARKWQLLMRGIEPIRFWRAYRAIFTGQSFALNTVNRVGEYLGRMVYLQEGNRLRSIALSVAGSFSQLIVTMLMGVLSLLYLRVAILDDTHHLQGLSVFWLDGLMYALSVGVTVCLILYYKLSLITKLVEKIPVVTRFSFFIDKLEDLHWKELTRILSLSLSRYMVFIVQYLIMLHVFEVDVRAIDGAAVIGVMFLVLAIVPTIALAELGLRGKVSLQLIGLLSVNQVGIIATAAGIWLINLVIPALAGSIFILGIRLFKKV